MIFESSVSLSKTIFFSIYSILAVKLIILLFISFMLVSEIFYPKTPQENTPKIYGSSTDFLLFDLPIPEWAQDFIIPIAGARIPNNNNLLPGAPRTYRNGKHEGVDFICEYGTPVQASKSGYVIFVGTSNVDTSRSYRERLLNLAKRLYKTPPEILEVLHGRRIVLDHGIIGGCWVVTVYSHLSKIRKGLKIGTYINQGDLIGYVGNSGTSKVGTQNGAHLHFEIRVNGYYLGESMTFQETREFLKTILNS